MKKLKTIVADDSQPQLESLCEELKRYCPQVEIVAKTQTLEDTLNAIKNHGPELVVLDVEFHEGGTSFNLIEKLVAEGDIDFQIIFVSGHAREKNYAVQAAEFSALQCLQKPIDPQKLIKAVEQAEAWFTFRERQAEMIYTQQIAQMMQLVRTRNFNTPFFVRTVKNVRVRVVPEQVLYLESDGKTTKFYLTDGSIIVGMENIGFYEFLTENERFVRIHQSYIVNLDNVALFNPSESYVKMMNEKIIYASRQGTALLRDRIG
ncbi:MAG: LytR/AlgR family response regulator transcription factor [Runella sp.]